MFIWDTSKHRSYLCIGLTPSLFSFQTSLIIQGRLLSHRGEKTPSKNLSLVCGLCVGRMSGNFHPPSSSLLFSFSPLPFLGNNYCLRNGCKGWGGSGGGWKREKTNSATFRPCAKLYNREKIVFILAWEQDCCIQCMRPVLVHFRSSISLMPAYKGTHKSSLPRRGTFI